MKVEKPFKEPDFDDLRKVLLREPGQRGGNFAFGAGNSITDFIPLQNYYAALDELRRWNEKNG